jgi:hypothetical protein
MTFWTEDILQLLRFNDGIMPSSTYNLASNMNAIARLSCLICLIISLMNPSLAIITLCITMLLTMVGFYNVESAKERYENVCEADNYKLPNNLDEYVSDNSMLSRGANFKTLFPLIDSTKIRSHDHIAWKNNDMSVPIVINDQSPFDMDSSGYNVNEKNITYFTPDDSLPEISIADVVDPRFTGYGPSDRCYLDPQTGSTKYFYNDIDSIRMPNYISRSSIDIYPWAPSYGSGYDGRYDATSTNGYAKTSDMENNRGLLSIKQNALDAYTNNTGRAREELQESLMRKRNGEMWQWRVAPIYQ